MSYVLLFYEFFKIGLFAIGGGLATLPFLYDLAAQYPWFSEGQLTDMIAIAESTPGPLGVNMATFAGYQAAGISGGIIATLGLILPSFCITLVLCRFLSKFSMDIRVQQIFYGLRPAVAGLIAAVAVSLLQIALFSGVGGSLWMGLDVKILIFFLFILLFVLKFKLHPIVYIGVAAIVGIIFKF